MNGALALFSGDVVHSRCLRVDVQVDEGLEPREHLRQARVRNLSQSRQVLTNTWCNAPVAGG